MRVAVGQIAPLLGRVERNLERCLQVCEGAAKAGCELLVLPECALSGYLFERREEAAESTCQVPGSVTEAIVRASRELGLVCVVGLLERDGVGLRNSALVVSPSGIAACYRKAHLPVLGVDRFVVAGGEPPPVCELAGVRIGLAVCYDLLFPEHARVLALAGTEVLCVPTNWHGDRCRRVEFLTRTRAFENRVYLLLANRVGQEHDAVFCGRSQVVAPDGSVLAEAGGDEELLVAEIDLAGTRSKDVVRAPGADELHLFADRRPALYGSLVRDRRGPARPPVDQATVSISTG